jgi:hypothetical protein
MASLRGPDRRESKLRAAFLAATQLPPISFAVVRPCQDYDSQPQPIRCYLLVIQLLRGDPTDV